MTLAERLLARVGKTTQDFKPNTTLGQVLRGRGVRNSPELARIVALPRRETFGQYPGAATPEELTGLLSLPGCRAGETSDGRCAQCLTPLRLNAEQGAALSECYDFNGLLGFIGVGHGKTLITFLLPTVLEIAPALLVVPAGLRDRTLSMLGNYSRHWKISRNLRVFSYETLSHPKHKRDLWEIAPRLLIPDEAHAWKNKGTVGYKRVRAYLKEHPDTVYAPFSGTPANRSILEYAHHAEWALHSGSPVPRDWQTQQEWADCLDEKVDPMRRLQPGVLEGALCHGIEADDPLQRVRLGYQSRLRETPGVIATTDLDLPCSLSVSSTALELAPRIRDTLSHIRQLGESPTGDVFPDPMSQWRACNQVATGFYYRWDPPAPREWRDARAIWHRGSRETLTNNRRGYESAFEIAAAVVRGEYPHLRDAYQAWKAVEPSFTPKNVAVWLDYGVVDWCIAWAKEHKSPVFTTWVEFGRAFAERSGMPYFGAGTVQQVEALRETVGCCLSAHAFHKGVNVQHLWSQALVSDLGVPITTGKEWEQLLGRLQRRGQQADNVHYEVLISVEEQQKTWTQVMLDATAIQAREGQKQRLCFADITIGIENGKSR